MYAESYGLLKVATIKSVDAQSGLMAISLDFANSIVQASDSITVNIKIPYSTYYKNGVFSGSLPSTGTQVIVGLGSGGEYFFVSYFGNNAINIPDLSDNQYILKNSDYNIINLTSKDELIFGNDLSYQYYSNKNSKFSEINYPNIYTISSGKLSSNGIIKRDLVNNLNYGSKISSILFEKSLVNIGFDPSVTVNHLITSQSKNPGLVEDREIVFEFDRESFVESDVIEKQKYSEKKQTVVKYNLPNRYDSKTNTLSLGMNQPNHLIEIIKGTVVDTFGNILDINRYPIQLNKDNITLNNSNESNKNKEVVFSELKKRHRKGIAFHFELNAKKENTIIDFNSRADKAKERSRLFFDIDKEGQLKANIPASSETGNIPILVRYENFSAFSAEDNGNPNKFIFREDNLDIFHDSFVADGASFSTDRKNKKGGSISIIDDGANRYPNDRILNTPLAHGTAHHDILSTCITHQLKDFLSYQVDGQEIINVESISNLKNVVSSEIYISGEKANAGGRSGQINLDGSLELNVGANTIDRQSLWLDTSGGLVANIGRDKNKNSAVIGMDGNLLLQVGNFGISTDSRFQEENGLIDAAVDLRVMTKGVFSHLIRIDGNGISIMTPGKLNIFAKQDISIKTSSSLSLEAEQIFMNGLLVDNKDIGQSI